MEISEALKKCRENSKKRNFSQTWDIIINLRGVDFSKPENRFSGSVILPHGKGKKTRVCVIADYKVTEAIKLGVGIVTKDQLKKIEKSDIKKLAQNYDYFLGETTLMAQIGKILGPALGPRGKMPKPFPPTVNLEGLIKSGEKTFSLNVKNPVIQGAVGTESMKDEEIEENVKSVLSFVEGKLPKGKQQIDNVVIKLTMGKAVRVKI
jgi:large subunit ribosomal protein L1